MECHSMKMSDDSDLQVGGDNSSPSCVENSSQQKCYEDDRVDGEKRCSYNLTAAELQQSKVLVQRFMEDKQFEGRRNDDDVRSQCMIRSLRQVPAIKDDYVKPKARKERDDKFVGLVSNLDKKGTRLKKQMWSKECIVRKLRKHQERGWERILGFCFLSVIGFDPGGRFSMLLLSSTWSIVSWFPP